MKKGILIIDDEPNIPSILSKSLYEVCDFQGEREGSMAKFVRLKL